SPFLPPSLPTLASSTFPQSGAPIDVLRAAMLGFPSKAVAYRCLYRLYGIFCGVRSVFWGWLD
ncbi:Hypothetical predicted protein, partial [Olea europaea subsp. europaea]